MRRNLIGERNQRMQKSVQAKKVPQSKTRCVEKSIEIQVKRVQIEIPRDKYREEDISEDNYFMQ